MAQLKTVVIDDRLLIEELLHGLRGRRAEFHTTTYWYNRACRAAALGAGGHLSGPFDELGADDQRVAIASVLHLRDDIALPDPRPVVPVMVGLAQRHPRLNLLNLEAAAAGIVLGAEMWLSAETASGVLPAVLDAEGIRWKVRPLPSP